MSSSNRLFDVLPLIPRLLIIAIALGIYYFISTRYLFNEWETYIYYGVRIIIAYQILRGSAQTLLAPILTLVIALTLLTTDSTYHINGITTNDMWQLAIVGILGFFVTIFAKL